MIEVDVGLELGAFKLDVAFGDGANAGITALFGQSGCGKSLTLNMIAGLIRPDRGFIRLDGEPLVDVDKGVFVPPHKRRIGLVFQDSNLFPHISVKQNLLYGRWFAPKGSREISYDAVVETLGIGRLMDRRPARLSGGERQRVGIGRALLSCPKLLLFDEPLAALDMARKLEIMPLIERIRDEFQIPMIYVSHAIEEVMRLASTVVMLEAGRVKATGAPNEVFGAAAGLLEDRFEQSSALSATVGGENVEYGLTQLKHPAGTIWIPGRAGAAGSAVRLVVRAVDVVLATAPPDNTSVRSVLTGLIHSIERSGSFALVDIALEGEGGPLMAVVTRQAVDELKLGPGARVYALLKASAIDERTIGRPTESAG